MVVSHVTSYGKKGISILDFPFEPWKLFLVSHLVKSAKLLQHRTIVAGIVTCDITQLKNYVSHRHLKASKDYLMCNADAVKDLEQGSAKLLAIVRIIEFGESK
jgi:hypothetical protein